LRSVSRSGPGGRGGVMNRRKALAAILLVVGLAVAGFFALRTVVPDTAIAASGTVEATAADLGFNAPGRIAAVLVREGDAVTRGQLLAQLEASELEARVEVARAQLSTARAVLAELEAGARSEDVAQGRSAVRAASLRLEDARREAARARRLYEGGAISQASLDRAETAEELAMAAMDQAREQLGVLETGTRPERVAAQRAAVASSDAMVRQAEAALENASVVAPFDGRVTVRHREPGETVQPGLPVVTVMDPLDRWVRIYIPENRMGAIAIGQAAEVTSDTFEGRGYSGRVVFIASEAEFTPRNVQTREERVKLVYAVRVQIEGDPAFELKPGMPADVRIMTTSDAGASPTPDAR
jgi:HlyD family secretion protein